MAIILIVDDSTEDRLLMRTVLEAEGHEIIEAENGVQALEAARAHPPDLAISDILMPAMDGFALCRAWQKDPELRRVPFVHCSANYVEASDVAFAKEIGAAAFMAKPVEPGQIRATVNSILGGELTDDATARLRRLDDASFHTRHISTMADKMSEKVRELERTNTLLVDREHAFRQLFELSPMPMWVLDMATTQILAVNDTCVDKYGWSRAEFLKKKTLDIRPPEDAQRLRETLERMRHNRRDLTEQGVWRHILKDGRLIEVEIYARPIEFEGHDAAMALLNDVTESRQARRDLDRQMATLESALNATVETVMKMGELHDPYTAGHERRVGELSVAIGREQGMDPRELRGLEIMGSLHDVGKITVPTELLVKPGKLTRNEFELIKEHAQQGYEILRKLEFPWPVADVAWQHHERLDGSGYPRGLKGDEITAEARILAVADVVEAMSSHRPYRPALGIEVALEEIEKNAGRLYCPRAAEACLGLFRERGFVFSN